MKEPEAGLMLHKEDLTNGRTTSRKTEMVTQWVQGGSSEVLNPFLPVRERSGGEIPPNDKTGGSTTSSSLDEKWRFIASSVSEAQAPTKPPSPRKRYGKVRKPKGAKTSESVAVTNILPEEIEPGTVSNQTPEPGDDLEPIEEIADAVLSEANPSEGSISARASREGSEPKTDRIRSRRIFTPPEILPPFTTPTTVSIFQDHPPDQSPVWETRHAHAAKVGILVDVSAPLDNSKEVPKPPPGYESSPLNTGPGHSQAPSQQLINLHAASEDEYPSLRPPSRPEDPKTQRSSMGPPSRPLKVGSRTLRIVKPKGSVSGSSSTADSGTSKEIRNKPLQEILQSSTEVNSREYKYTMGQQKPAQKKEKVRCDNAAKTEASKADLRKLNDLAEVVLDRALYFRGEVKLEVQIGRILVNSLPTQFRKMPFRVDTWPTIFAARNGSGVAETTFTKMYVFIMVFGFTY